MNIEELRTTIINLIEDEINNRGIYTKWARTTFRVSSNLTELLNEYIDQTGPGVEDFAKKSQLSTSTLRKALSRSSSTSLTLVKIRDMLVKEAEKTSAPVPHQPERNGISTTSAPSYEWHRTSVKDTQRVINKVASCLNELLTTLQRSNSLNSDDTVLNTVQRAQLIAMLEAAIRSLKAPYISKTETKGWMSALFGLIRRSGEHAVEAKVKEKMTDALEAGEQLVETFAYGEGLEDISNLFS